MQSRVLRLNICNILSPYALKERIRSGSQDNWTQREHATTKKSKDRKQAPEYRELTNWRTIEIYEGDQKRLRMHELKSIMCFLRFRNFVLLVIWNLIFSYIFFSFLYESGCISSGMISDSVPWPNRNFWERSWRWWAWTSSSSHQGTVRSFCV